jgi:3-oxoacyl-[acyl-carrier protein] reductase
MKLLEKTVLVTGGSRGIGYAIAHAFHREGAKVAITGRHQDTLLTSAEQIGPNCFPFVCDHSDKDSIKVMATDVISKIGSPDILINNAGCMQSKPVLELSLEMWNLVLATNLTGVFLTTQALLPGMIEKKRGDIIMISSMSGKKGDAGSAAYSASKFGLQGFSQALMHEVRRHNIRVMVMNPSRVDTSSNPENDYGPGVTLHARDLAETALHLVTLPGRTMIRDMEIWGTNPF